MDARGFVESVLGEAGFDPAPALGVLEELLSQGLGGEEALDRLEAELSSWAALEPRWGRAARLLQLARIYLEARGDWRPALRPRGVEERLSWQALRLLRARYLLRDPGGRLRETPDAMIVRVSSYVAQAEHGWMGYERAFREFYRLLSSLRFVPNSPTLMNSATRYPQLAACFVVPLGDDMDSIMDALRVSAWLFKSGAGAGYDFSPLRPRGAPIAGTGGRSSGPVSFMRLFDTLADVVKEGGKRRAAMMGILHDWHADVLEFARAKCGAGGVLENFNISVAIHDSFMRRALGGGEWRLYDPSTCPGLVASLSEEVEEAQGSCRASRVIGAAELLDAIAECAWRSGDPGVVFIDTINRHNATPVLGRIHSTNPCGETPLLDWEACNLGSINLARYVDEVNREIRWEELGRDVELAVRFLDDVIEVSWYPDKRIAEAVRRTRKVGLGVMGWADTLAALGIPYDSHDALYLADKVMEFIAYHARKASNELASEKGPYPAFQGSIHSLGRFNFEPQVPAREIYDPSRVSGEARAIVADRPALDWELLRSEMKRGTRNATVTTIAPTGSISIIAGASASIEPYFALVYLRRSDVGSWIEVNRFLRRWLEDNGMLSEEVLLEIAEKGGGIRWAPWAPEELKRRLPTALEIGWEWHVRMQAAFQRWTDNAVSKTVNLPARATVADVRETIILAWRLGCKGVTVYRDRSREGQVVSSHVEEIREALRSPPPPARAKDKRIYTWLRIGDKQLMMVHEDYSGGCPTCDL
ncbi:MAG: adenosylcobalamin-dependent ribonucleoside-diphosphate reductase [Desulfurococcales archaeon]|nr:adenosylcobalamin-dependent ribonucleoside-diphosphate reductase [Desulfurococcales archaeon]